MPLDSKKERRPHRVLSNTAVDYCESTSIHGFSYWVSGGILTRVGEGGPILSKTQTQPFWLYELVEGFVYGVEQLPSGLYKVPDTLFLSPYAPEDIEVRIEVFVSGVTFEDGSTVKTLKKEDFSVLGTYNLILLKDEERLGSTCHRIKVYQNGELIGQRR